MSSFTRTEPGVHGPHAGLGQSLSDSHGIGSLSAGCEGGGAGGALTTVDAVRAGWLDVVTVVEVGEDVLELFLAGGSEHPSNTVHVAKKIVVVCVIVGW